MSIKSSWIYLASLPFQSVPAQMKISLHSRLSVWDGTEKQSWLFITVTALWAMSVKTLYQTQLSVFQFLTLRQIKLSLCESTKKKKKKLVILQQSFGFYLVCTLTAVPRYLYGHKGPLLLWVHPRWRFWIRRQTQWPQTVFSACHLEDRANDICCGA